MGAVTEAKPVSVSREQRRNDALRRAIAFGKIPLLTGLIYFAWRGVSIVQTLGTASGSQLALYITFFVVEWTFASKCHVARKTRNRPNAHNARSSKKRIQGDTELQNAGK